MFLMQISIISSFLNLFKIRLRSDLFHCSNHYPFWFRCELANVLLLPSSLWWCCSFVLGLRFLFGFQCLSCTLHPVCQGQYPLPLVKLGFRYVKHYLPFPFDFFLASPLNFRKVAKLYMLGR